MSSAALTALARHWPEYLMEAAGLGLFMVSAGSVTTLLEYANSPAHHAVADPLARRALTGVAMGLTAVAIIYSPWGRQSGAHLNPAVTLTFLRLGKIAPWDAAFYILAQTLGGIAGVTLVFLLFGNAFAAPPVTYIATVPGPLGATIAFFAEALIAAGLMFAILIAINNRALMRYTGLFAGALIATYITLEAPLSGMSINPARTVASAVPSGIWTALWVYLAGPLMGMLAAAEIYGRAKGRVFCAKLNHNTHRRCIFRCGYHAEAATTAAAPMARRGIA